MGFENRELDELIESIGRWIIEDEKKPGILNPVRIQQIAFSNGVLKKMLQGTDTHIATDLHNHFKSMGSICIEGESLIFEDCKWLGRALEFASNVEIYPLSNGNIRMTLTFHNLTQPLDNS